MTFVKFYPSSSDLTLEPKTAIRFRQIIDGILADLEGNYGVKKEERMSGPMRGGQCYELEEITRDRLIELLALYEAVYSIQGRTIDFQGEKHEHALLIRLG